MVCYVHLFKNFPVLVIHTVKGFSVVIESVLVTQLCLILCNLPGSPVHGILQTRILELGYNHFLI